MKFTYFPLQQKYPTVSGIIKNEVVNENCSQFYSECFRITQWP